MIEEESARFIETAERIQDEDAEERFEKVISRIEIRPKIKPNRPNPLESSTFHLESSSN